MKQTKKRWLPPTIIPNFVKDDPFSELALEEASVRAPQFAPNYFSGNSDDRHSLMPMMENLLLIDAQKKELENQKNASAVNGVSANATNNPATSVSGPTANNAPRDNTSIANMQPKGQMVPQLGGNLQSIIYGTKPQFPQQDDGLLDLIAQRLKNSRFR